ncbi:AT-hook motif nuclear-localized protein 2 [Raphanus sativus]|uniref:AT-hook motif nuclear-localized protein n=1 Tax=Raphanus sativus TaxID=3726 RepID=A0A6J0KAQ8_RAPSA|nr:AT-hook motif nuclear-localized protein 2 [Raphanus sativus]KAJ4912916.1 AT-hook motif nuclear-localized protein 2 [Raphanus sativus]
METTGEVVKTTGGSNDGLTVARSNAPSDFHTAPRSETSNPPPTSVAPPPPPPQNSLAPTAPPSTAEGFPSGPMKKKRGRPRKYGHNGAAVTLSPNPISSAAPTTSHVIDFSAAEKRGKVKPTTASSFVRTNHQVENLGEWAPSSAVGANFTPHIITVNAGEDVTKRIISFSQQGALAICVLCANGVVSSVTLRQHDSSGGTLTYEGRFEILSLSGSFMPADSDGTRSRTGGMTVSLASPDGRVVGGGVAGLLVAATPIQVVLGSFIAGTNHQEQNPRKQHNHNFPSSPMPPPLQMGTWTPQQHKEHDFNITL